MGYIKMTTANTLNESTVETIKNTILTNRIDIDTRKGASFINLHTMQVLANHNINPDSFTKLSIQREGDGFVIAQKSFKRAMFMLNGIANNNFSHDFVPFEITASLINYAAFEGKVSGELATAFLTRLIELSEEAQARAGNKMKLKNRASKGVSTASAQGSSVKGMLRAFGIVESKKRARETIADTTNPLFNTALNIIKAQFKTK